MPNISLALFVGQYIIGCKNSQKTIKPKPNRSYNFGSCSAFEAVLASATFPQKVRCAELLQKRVIFDRCLASEVLSVTFVCNIKKMYPL